LIAENAAQHFGEKSSKFCVVSYVCRNVNLPIVAEKHHYANFTEICAMAQ